MSDTTRNLLLLALVRRNQQLQQQEEQASTPIVEPVPATPVPTEPATPRFVAYAAFALLAAGLILAPLSDPLGVLLINVGVWSLLYFLIPARIRSKHTDWFRASNTPEARAALAERIRRFDQS
jgi:hypothetical protein